MAKKSRKAKERFVIREYDGDKTCEEILFEVIKLIAGDIRISGRS